jgi:hypothetical protein
MMPPPEQFPGAPPMAFAPPTNEPELGPITNLPNDKEHLGEILYTLVEKKNPKNAAKITGMLLEMEIDQIQNICRESAQLDKWVSEALKVFLKLYNIMLDIGAQYYVLIHIYDYHSHLILEIFVT